MVWKTKKTVSLAELYICPVDERGQRRLARVVWADKKATVAQIITLYKYGKLKTKMKVRESFIISTILSSHFKATVFI